MVVGDIDAAARDLTERADTKLQTIAGPDFLLDREQIAVIRLRVAQAGFQPTQRFVFAKAMRDGDDQRLRHDGSNDAPQSRIWERNIVNQTRAFTGSSLIRNPIYLPCLLCYMIAPQFGFGGDVMFKQLQRFLKDESGATAIEYGLITSSISVAIIPAIKDVGQKLVGIFSLLQAAV